MEPKRYNEHTCHCDAWVFYKNIHRMPALHAAKACNDLAEDY